MVSVDADSPNEKLTHVSISETERLHSMQSTHNHSNFGACCCVGFFSAHEPLVISAAAIAEQLNNEKSS